MWAVFDKYTDASVYFVVAAAATVIFLIRLVMAFVGGDGADHGGDFDTDLAGDADFHGDAAHDASGGAFKLFSLLSIMAFFMGAGWMGVVARVNWDLGATVAGILAVAFGLAMMALSATLTYLLKRINRQPRFDYRTLVGSSGRVYLTIPPKGAGQGQVELTINGRQSILRARSTGPEIAAFATVSVVAVGDDRTVVVEPRA